jgi:hypothetical protein
MAEDEIRAAKWPAEIASISSSFPPAHDEVAASWAVSRGGPGCVCAACLVKKAAACKGCGGAGRQGGLCASCRVKAGVGKQNLPPGLGLGGGALSMAAPLQEATTEVRTAPEVRALPTVTKEPEPPGSPTITEVFLEVDGHWELDAEIDALVEGIEAIETEGSC